MTTKQKQGKAVAEMWADLRINGDMVVDLPGNKLGVPWAVPYEGVCFPVEIDGTFVFASIPTDQVARFAIALINNIGLSEEIDSKCEAEIAAHDAISKAKGV